MIFYNYNIRISPFSVQNYYKIPTYANFSAFFSKKYILKCCISTKVCLFYRKCAFLMPKNLVISKKSSTFAPETNKIFIVKV